jgi:hypothetical protein
MIKCDHLERSVPVDKELREKIPVISFLMMMEVLLYHCESPDNALAVSALDLQLNTAIDNFVIGVPSLLCMSWFFGLTGFLLFRNLSFQNLGSKLKTRVQTLLVPYLLWQIIYIIKSILQGNSWTAADMFGQVFLLRIWPPLGAFWYVYTVFLFAVLFSPILLLLFQNKKIGWFSVLTLILLLYIFWNYLYVGNGRYHYTGNIKMHFPAYVVGSYCGSLYREDNRNQILACVVGFLLAGALLDGLVEDLLLNMAIATLPMLILFVLPVPEKLKNKTVYRCTFLILATHQSLISLFMGPIRNTLYSLIPSATVSNLGGRILCILLIVAVNMGIRALMIRFTPRTLKVLTGGRC